MKKPNPDKQEKSHNEAALSITSLVYLDFVFEPLDTPCAKTAGAEAMRTAVESATIASFIRSSSDEPHEPTS
jgi:hypothetical protein